MSIAPTTATGAVLTVKPTGFSGARCVIEEAGVVVATIKSSHLRTRADLTIGEVDFLLERKGMLGDFVLRRGDTILAAATKPSALRRVFHLTLGEAEFRLRSRGFLAKRFTLEQDERVIGEIHKTGVIRMGATVRLPSDWPLPLKVFAFWLAWTMWKRDAAAAAGG